MPTKTKRRTAKSKSHGQGLSTYIKQMDALWKQHDQYQQQCEKHPFQWLKKLHSQWLKEQTQ